MKKKIAYIMSRFPHLPETFILREMIELEHYGWEVALYPLIRQRDKIVHAEARPWLSRVRHLPFGSPQVFTANVFALLRQCDLYTSLWGRTCWENRHSLDFLMRAIALLPKAIHAARWMQREGIMHMHAHYATHPALFAWLIHRLTGISYSVTVHAHDIFVCHAMLETKLRDAAFIVAISAYNRDYLTQVLGQWVKTKTHIIHCGINPANYTPCSEASKSRERFELISIGSLQPYKGYPFLLQACTVLRDRGIPLHCRIIGGGKERSTLEQQIVKAGLEGIVELLGPRTQEEIAQLLPTAHCYVQPSIMTASGKMEGIPVSLMEALACKLPVVATSLSGIPELVRPGETGLLVPPADAPALANAIATIYADLVGADRMAGAGRVLVQGEFNLQTNVKRLASLFEDVA